MSNYKLKKPRGFEVSEPILVTFGTHEVECANLKKGGLLIQSSIMVANDGEWHEIEIADLVLDTVHLPSFKHHIESNGLQLSDLGIAPKEVSYELTHDDFMELQGLFPAYDYIQIAKLHEYEKRNGLPNGIYHKKETLRMLANQGITITDYIRSIEDKKHAIIGKEEYSAVVDESKPQQNIVVETIPITGPAQVPADSISISLFETLSPAKITELTELRNEQTKIAEENPVIVITDSKTYASAKKTKAVLLSASTKIDGKNGIFANAKRLINDFKSKFDKEGEEIAKITREPHDKQNKLITDWDNRVLLQVQNRTKMLTEVPFVYDSLNDMYSIGSISVNQKGIEELSDKDFSDIIEKGKTVKSAMDQLKSEQDAKIAAQEKTIADLQATVNALLAAQGITNTVAAALGSEPIFENPIIDHKTEPEFLGVGDNGPEYTNVFTIKTGPQNAISPLSRYELPSPDNKLLNDLDLAHVSVLEENQYLQYRDGFIYGLSKCAEALQAVFDNPDKNVVKSEEIKKLIAIWK